MLFFPSDMTLLNASQYGQNSWVSMPIGNKKRSHDKNEKAFYSTGDGVV